MQQGLKTLLEPFRRLHSVASAIITGSVDIEYLNNIIASVSAPHIDTHVLINMATAIEERGDGLVRGGDYLEAFSTYMAALNGVQHGYLLPDQTWTVDGGVSARVALGALLMTLRSRVNDARRRLEEMGIRNFRLDSAWRCLKAGRAMEWDPSRPPTTTLYSINRRPAGQRLLGALGIPWPLYGGGPKMKIGIELEANAVKKGLVTLRNDLVTSIAQLY